MNTTKHIAISATLAGLFAVAPAQADDVRQTIKPLHAVSFQIGDEHIVGYYLNESGRCTLRVTRAAEPSRDGPTHFAVTTFEQIVDAGSATRYVSTAGNAFEFACADGALAMNVTQLQQVASSDKR
jgi:hypothetical protein